MMKRYIYVLMATALLFSSCHRESQSTTENVVKVKMATTSSLSHSDGQSYPGTIEEMSGTSVSFACAGTIKRLAFDNGQMVTNGQFLGEVDATTASNAVAMAHSATAQAQAGVKQAQDAVHQAEDAYARMKKLHDNGSLPDIQWVEVQTKVSQARQMLVQAQQAVASTRASEQIARKGKSDTRLFAPTSGYVVNKNAEVGQNIMPGLPIAKIVKIDQVKVKVSIPETEISKIKIGKPLHITVSSLGGRSYSARVTEKGVQADPLTRTYEVKAIISNLDHKLLPGMVCDVYTQLDNGQTAIALAANLIQIDTDNIPFVWTDKNGLAHKNIVTLGGNEGDNVIITAGLNPGDRIIIEGQQKVSEGMKVRQ